MAVADSDRRIRFLNSAAELLLGYSDRQVHGRSLSGLGFDGLDDLVARAVSEQQGFAQDLVLTTPHLDQQLPVACRVTPLPDESGGGAVVEMLDVSQTRQLGRENALISQHGVSRRIVRQLAHEIRNPLGGLRGAAQLLDRELDDDALREYTQVIIREADRLVNMTTELLGPTRVACKGPVNIHELIERVILLLERDIAPGVQLDRDYDPSLPVALADADQLYQALLNVALNAVQSVGESGRICFRTRALVGYVIGDRRHRLMLSLEVEDDGPGIPDELVDSVFYPLVSGREGGSGLGLPLAQDLVSRQGGLIEFVSEPGRTVFMLRVPVAEEC
ncbi:MAG TPA: PAS domain-containing protein [Chromatiales bacterium]|nr:PAS domain-containing protein [Chromatiales bacterium]